MGNESDMFKVLVIGNVRREGIELLETFSRVTILPEPAPRKEIIAHIGDCDAILHKIGPLDREILEHQKRVRFIARHGVGLDELDMTYIRQLGIPVSITLDLNSNAVAEFTIAVAFNILRNINRGEAMVKVDHSWDRESLMGYELKGLTAGVVGYGRIGRRVADYFRFFCAKVVVSDPLLPDDAVPAVFERVDLEGLIRRADIVSLHCPFSPETRNLIGEQNLGLFRRNAILINAARGGVVDARALARALRNRELLGAAMDVFSHEPPDFSDELFTLKNFLPTPHIAAMTYDAQVKMAIATATEIKRVLVEGLPPTNDVAASG